MEFDRPLSLARGPIPGLIVVHMPVHGDARGWFKENWQRKKMVELGLPDFGPVQNNISFNDSVGTTRGIHAEPWDKYVSVASGRVFAAWVDLREGSTFGTTFSLELDPSVAVFVPRGVGNAYQTLEPDTAYTYLVNAHWSPQASYTFLNLADTDADIPWPIPLERATVSEKDRLHPRLEDVIPFAPRRVLVLGASGQLGTALREVYQDDRADFVTRREVDITSPRLEDAVAWDRYDVVINAAAYTAVDAAESPRGRHEAWSVNVSAVAALTRIALRHRLTLVHISSDYVFDGSRDDDYDEDAPLSPLGVYAQTKAAADAIVSILPMHYLIRVSWLVGDGSNFVRTMHRLAESGADPVVIDDQFGRLTFASTVAQAIRHLLDSGAPHGSYNVSGTGEKASWYAIARDVFSIAGHDPDRVRPTTSADYARGRDDVTAPRPANGGLDVSKIVGTGFAPPSWREHLEAYVRSIV